MRYEDASGSFQASGPIANDDSDTLPAGSRQAATGNLITGEGTQYGSAGADSAPGAHITTIAGKGGEDSSFAGGKLSVTGEHGNLSVDAEGNYNYMANKGAPENVRDRFTYTLADNQGNSDTAALVIELGKTPVVIKADAQQVVPGPDGVVTLPPGVDLSDVMVVGRNLVINMPDGTQLIIVDGAIFVPQLVLDGVQVPATNVAALLIGQEPQPAAGELPPSSGGNFALPPPPLDPGVPLGDLLPPTVRDYIPPEPQEVLDQLDEDPEIFIQPDGQPASAAAVDQVDEAGLPARDGDLPGEPEGSGEEAAAGANGDPSEATSGTIIINSPDGVGSVTINGELVTGATGQEIEGLHGTLTITGFDGDNILYSYLLTDNTSGDDTQDDFLVVLTDDDGDTASATLTIDIIDDVPTARDDVDSVTEGGPEVADGNVLTGSGGVDANSTDGVADTVGADDADLTGFNQGGTNGTLGAPFAAQYGTLVLNADGSYTYTLDSDDPAVRALGDGDTLTEVFTYTLTDGDGDVDTATLTITIVGTNEAPVIGNAEAVVSEEGLPGGIEDSDGDPSDTTNSPTDSGTMTVSDPDGDPVTVTLSTAGLPALTSNLVPVVWALSDGGHTLTGTAGGDPIITITIDNDGNFTVSLDGPIDHADDTVEDIRTFDVQVTVDDGAETDTGTLTVTIEDDSPSITAGEVEPTLLVDESDFTVNDMQNFGDVFNVQFGGDGGDPDSVTYALGTPGGDSGLVDTLSGDPVVLTLEGGEVVGRAGPAGPIVFIVSVNADGDVTVDQLRAVVHADPTDHDDAISLSNDNLITLTATATDNDGDSDSATINIGNNIVLEDDGPDISRNEQSAPDLVTDDTNTPNDTDSASFAGLFNLDFGADGPKDVNDDDVADSDAVVFSLSIDGGNGTDSGLLDVVSGDRILLRVVGDTIEGYLENATGTVAFTLTLDPETGEITQEQDRAITHNDPLDPVESGDSAATMAGNLIVLTATITDGDLDTDTATANIGDSFHFEDDGPSAVNDVDSIQGGAGPATGNVITGVDIGGGDANGTDGNADDVGADTPGSISKIQSVNEPLNVDDVADGSGDFVVDGEFGTLTINEDGSYSYTRTNLAVGGVNDVFTYTLTDADGDSVTATLTISIADNFPIAGTANAAVDDDGLDGANAAAGADDINANTFPNPDDLDGPGSSEATFRGQLTVTGGDGDIDFSLVAPGAGITVGQETVTISGTGALLTATITASPDASRIGDPLFTVSLNQESGEYIVTLVDNVLHGDDANNNEDGVEVSVNIPFQVVDADGDPSAANGTLTIVFNDDVPTAAVSVAGLSISHDETPGLDGDADDDNNAHPEFAGVLNTGNDPDVVANPIGFATSTGAVSSTGTVFGADGGTAVFSLAVSAAGVDSTLNVTGGESILLFKEGNVIVGRVSGGTFNGQAAFAIAIDPTTGVITMVQYLSIQHPNPASLDESVSILNTAISAVNTVTDADGDVSTASTPIGNLISFQDDGPTAVIADPITEGLINDGSGDSASALLDGGGNDIVSDNMGADGGKVIFTQDSIDAMDAFGFEHSGDLLSYDISEDGQTLTGFVDDGDGVHDAGDTDVLKIELQTGVDGNEYTVTILETIDTTHTINFNDAGYDFQGGNDPWAAFTNVLDNSQDLLMTPIVNGVPGGAIQSSSILGGVNNSNDVAATETFRLDYVIDVIGDPSKAGSDNDYAVDNNDDHVFEDHYTTNDAAATFSSTSPGTSDVLITAWDDSDALGNDEVGDGTQDVITSITLSFAGGEDVEVTDTGTGPYTVTVNDGLATERTYTVTFDVDGDGGVRIDDVFGTGGAGFDGTRISVHTDDGYNALEISNVGGLPFKIGDFGIIQTTIEDLDFSVPISVIDGDGDIVASGDLDIHADAPEVQPLVVPFSAMMNQEEQLQKTAANSNTLTLATAVAAAGFVEPVAAHDNGNHNGHGQNSEFANFAAPEVVELNSVSDDGGDAAVSMLAPEASTEASAPADTSSSSSSDNESASNSLDDSAASAPESNAAPAADDGGSNSSAEAAGPVAPTVAMVSAEALQAAANENGNAQQGGSVEQIVAEAMHQGGSQDIDGLLANLPGGNGGLQAIAHMASPDVAAVSGWHMGSHGAIGAGFDMMFKMDVATHHQDAVQPVANG